MDLSIRNTGITVIHEPDSGLPIVDIVVIHGLQGHPYKTWACRHTQRSESTTVGSSVKASENENGSQKSYQRVVPWLSRGHSPSPSIRSDPDLKRRENGSTKGAELFWPKDLLPVQYPSARILVYGYDTRVTNYLSGSTNENSIHSHGKDLLYSLAACRSLDRPLVFIAHSLGGIVVKEMLASSSNSLDDLENVVASTAAVIFLGTPHRGSPDLALLGDRARSMISALRMRTNPAILDALRLKTNDLERAQEAFSTVWSQYDFRVKTFQEGLGLPGLNFGPFGKKVVPHFSSLLGDVRERAESIQANHMEMCRFMGLDDPNYKRLCGEVTSIYDWLAGSNATTANRVDKHSLTANTLAISSRESRAGAMGEREKICLQSLLFPHMNQRTQSFEKPAEGTCSWFFEHEAFVNWLAHKSQTKFCGLLWLRGKPGSGKSTLLKEAFFRATIETSVSEHHVASFFFNAKGDDLEHSPTGMLRSILHQMCSRSTDLLGALLNFAQSRRALFGEDLAPWEEAELRAFFKSAIAGHKERTVIFIDAIDECDSNSIRDVADFWRETTKTAYHAGVQLSVCLSSRHFPAIAVNDCPEIIMEDHNHADIVKFVTRRLDLGMAGNYADQQAIQKKILQKSGGVFLWVSLVLKDILRKHDEGQGLRSLLKHLDSVPRELEDLFCQLLTTAPSSTMIVRIFQWALLPTKPLRLHEWHHILAFIGDTAPSSLDQWRQSDVYTKTDEQLEKRIIHMSRGLLGFNMRTGNGHEPADDAWSDRAGAGSLDLNTGETRVVQVIHESVRQYFMEGPGFSVLNSDFAERSLANAHLSIMSVCLDYIRIAELNSLVKARKVAQRFTSSRSASERASSVASFGSAGTYDGAHTPVELDMHQRDTLPANGERSRSNGISLSMSPSMGSDDNFFALRSLKGLSGSAGAHDVMRGWLKDQSVTDEAHCDEPEDQSVTDQAHCDEPALPDHASRQASTAGSSQVLEDYIALLSYATSELFTHARKADVEGLDPSHVVWRLRDGTWDRWKALQEDVDERTEFLYFAANLGLSFWLKADRVWKDSEVISSIDFAIENSNTKVLGNLLTVDAFPSAGYTRETSSKILAFLVSAPDVALLQAYLSQYPSQEHDAMNSIMAKKDILENKYGDGRTALHLAVIQQNKAAVSVLLEHGADVSAADRLLRTSLHLACISDSRLACKPSSDKSRSDIIELLLAHHAEVNAVDAQGQTPLSIACSNIAWAPWGDRGESLSSTDVHFDRDDFDVVDVLLKHGADTTIRNSLGLLPLHDACWTSSGGVQSKVPIVSKLLDYGSPVNAVGEGGGTPLHIACFCSEGEIVEELLRRGANPSSQDHEGRSPLHIAAARSTEKVVEALLLFPGTSVDAMDDSGSTPLHVACDLHSSLRQRVSTILASIRLLLAQGAKAYTMRDLNGDSPADIARKNGFKEAVELLAAESCDAHLRRPSKWCGEQFDF
ncbi:hypothetical protein INS49_006154 [Diaporthe citri]|uniref:uncharacterized protein n=1 Tax=Diaporthe citri TaxID=83186 RepID=UPI001C8013D0|nr:uncharacterized protein INS49_006154 [Diaporthe citri]KAG6364552.1 hypothetical protein INS49_006154 [Diaporthe citri]